MSQLHRLVLGRSLDMPRWVKAFRLLATIQSASGLPPFVWGDWAGIALRFIFCCLTYLLAYATVTENAGIERPCGRKEDACSHG